MPTPSRSSFRVTATRIGAYLVAAALLVVLASCSSSPPPSPPPPAAPPGPTALPGWKLTLPLASDKGTASEVEPADLAPPYLARDAGGSLTFWAPVNGATTKNSDHARTELVNLSNFPAGSAPHALAASVSVAQVPTESQDVIIGQIHGADDISSVPFVMLHYDAGAIKVVVKQKQSGSDSNDVPLLSDVPLGARFDFGIRDNGNGTLTFTGSYAGQNASVDAPLPDAFRGATVRYQAGAYQQNSSKDGPAADTDGARVTFYSLDAGSGAVVTSP